MSAKDEELGTCRGFETSFDETARSRNHGETSSSRLSIWERLSKMQDKNFGANWPTHHVIDSEARNKD